jgi:hypothetical protein
MKYIESMKSTGSLYVPTVSEGRTHGNRLLVFLTFQLSTFSDRPFLRGENRSDKSIVNLVFACISASPKMAILFTFPRVLL